MRKCTYHRWMLAMFMVFTISTFAACQHLGEEKAPQRDFTTESLLLDETPWPPGWYTSDIRPTPDAHGALEHIEIFFIPPVFGSGGFQEIYRYKYFSSAKRAYAHQREIFFQGSVLYGPSTANERLQTTLNFADEAYVACMPYIPKDENDNQFDSCQALARYGEFIVLFHTEVAPDLLSYEQLTKILSSLDDKFERAFD